MGERGKKGKRKKEQEFFTLIMYDEHVRARIIINRALSIYFRMRASQCYQFVPAMLSILIALALTNIILDVALNEGLPIRRLLLASAL